LLLVYYRTSDSIQAISSMPGPSKPTKGRIPLKLGILRAAREPVQFNSAISEYFLRGLA